MKVDTTENVEIKIKNNEQYNNSQLKGFFTSYLAYCIIVTVFGGTLAVGWNIGEFNTPSQTLKRFFTQSYAERYNKNMTNDTLLLLWSTANGIMPLGGAFGGMFTGLSVEKFGHIHSMMLINVIVVINAVLYFISKYIKSYETLIVGRVLTGFVSGFFCGVCPLYLSEIPPVNLRGLSGTINALAMCIGNLLTNILGLPSILGTDSLWNVLLVLIVVPAIVHYVGLLFCVESPKYLYVTKNNRDKAKYALLKLRGEDQKELIENELAQLDEEKSETANQSNIPYTDLINKPNLRRALIVSIMLQASQQFSGIIVVSFYSADIFISLGLDSKTWAVYATIMVAFVETVMHGFTAVFIDKWGRRILLIVGMLGMSFSCFVLAITRIFSDQVEWFKIVAVVITVTYIIFYSIGPGPIPLLVTAELFDTKTRGKAVSIAVFLNWFFNFIVTITFPFIDDAIGGYSFIIYGVLLILFCIFTFFKVPETKNKPINEILKYFD